MVAETRRRLAPLAPARMHRYVLGRAASPAWSRPSPHRRQLPVTHLARLPAVEIVLNPDPEDDKVNAAVSQAIARAGVAAPSEPDAYNNAWRRAALARD